MKTRGYLSCVLAAACLAWACGDSADDGPNDAADAPGQAGVGGVGGSGGAPGGAGGAGGAEGTPGVQQFAVGGDMTCVLGTDGSVRCWGKKARADASDVGDDETPAQAGALDVGGRATQIALGDNYEKGDYNQVCAVLEDGALRCWFSVPFVGLRISVTSQADLGGAVKQVDGGELYNCVLREDGAVLCSTGIEFEPDVGDRVELGGKALQIAAGFYHTCALLEDGSVRCWGYNVYGTLGYGHTIDIGPEGVAAAGPVALGGKALQIAAGMGHTCALLEGGSVRCWGLNHHGQLGLADTTNVGDNETPAARGPVELGGKALQITVGDAHSCALLEGDSVRCWGENDRGQLGYGNSDVIGDYETPAQAGPVDLGGRARQIRAGRAHTCALLEGGELRCWGDNRTGALGYGHTDVIGDNETPAQAGAVQIF